MLCDDLTLIYVFVIFADLLQAKKQIYLWLQQHQMIQTDLVQPQIRKSWDSMENANKKRK